MKYLLSSIFALLILSGCSQVTVKEMELSKKAILFIEPEDGSLPRACIEPSPDAASALSLAFSTNAEVSEKVKLAAAASINKAESYIGLRTHSIQLLRDMTYRSCEAYLNKGITQAEYAHMLRRFQRSMIALMAIEQLTGVVKTAPVVVDLGSKTNIIQTMLDNQKSIELIDAKIIELNTTITDLNNSASDYNITNKLYTEQMKQYKSIKDTISETQNDTKEVLADGSITTKVVDINISSNIHSNQVTTLAIIGTVERLVGKLLEDDAPFLCIEYLKDSNQSKELNAYCVSKLSGITNASDIQLIMKAFNPSDSNLTDEDKEALKNMNFKNSPIKSIAN